SRIPPRIVGIRYLLRLRRRRKHINLAATPVCLSSPPSCQSTTPSCTNVPSSLVSQLLVSCLKF
ncbi:hypothetical protein KXW62_008186, partial [Aspergillus fumigatus]